MPSKPPSGVCSLLKLLENSAIQLQHEQAEASKKWAELLATYNLVTAENPENSGWITDPAFRSYLARGSSLAAAADKGLW